MNSMFATAAPARAAASRAAQSPVPRSSCQTSAFASGVPHARALPRFAAIATIGIAMATVMLSFLMMITRRKAIPQVIGFLSMENGLFFAATSATYGMPMVVELGIALDLDEQLLVGLVGQLDDRELASFGGGPGFGEQCPHAL